MKMPKKVNRKIRPRKSGQILVTKVMLTEARHELKHEITAVRLDMVAGFKQVDARFNEVDARFNKVDARFNEVDARFNEVDARFKKVDARFNEVDARFDRVDARLNKIDSKVEQVLAAVQRIGLIVEEQNAKNNFVLDGYANLHARVTKLES